MNGFGSERIKSLALWTLIIVMAVFLYIQFQQKDQRVELEITEFFSLVKNDRVEEARDERGKILGEYLDENNIKKKFRATYLPGQEAQILQLMIDNDMSYSARVPPEFLMPFISIFVPILFILFIFFFVMRQLQSGGAKAMSFGKSKARRIMEGETNVSFDDVAGCDEAKEELKEIVDFLRDPQRFTRLGGKMPKGVLLVGPPGTGKTLLARAVAGEAKVPFFSISGSDFVEMFVGVGAARVRDLFEQSKKNKPSLIFIDEIDAVGRQRFAGVGGGHDEREQTLNQLLVEMDGFETNEGVILLAGTNRPDVLDKALLRPGRFDRHITVDLPDLKGREAILKIYARSVKLGPDVNLERIARATPGFSGAHLENLMNEAALFAARATKDRIDQSDLEEAKDRVLMGPERRSMVMSQEERVSTAYHEAGHALIAHLHPDADPVHKVTIIPRGRALGVTAVHALEDRHSHSERQLKASLIYILGGRVAEEIKFNEFSTGASNDLQKVTDIAHRMVCEFGMSKKLGARVFGSPGNEVFYARDMSREPSFSDATAALIDEEIKRLIDDASEAARDLLTAHLEAFDRVSAALLERETLDGEELQMLIEGKTLPPLFDAPNGQSGASAPDSTEGGGKKRSRGLGELGIDGQPGLTSS